MRELAARVLAQTPGAVIALRPQREDEYDRHVLGERKQLLEEKNRRRVRPVEILEREDERAFLRESGEELTDHLERPPLQRLR